ncbi:MAG TPA: ubiquinol-cytochrome c reductase iron-sulfur subunit [Candidatus Dormibacteraeota bacterium]|jgi:cytochrome b6-f complex iron-sulfur subunit|nr:ubiquinol-cytochrome c reductase iron-sulfur subunit [Candidatus Dormibacteraeota bacterium]
MAVNPYETPRGRLHVLADVTRRQFLMIMGTLGALGATLFATAEILKFLFPGATQEEPLAFKVSVDPNAITVGNPLQITAKRVSIIRDDGGYYAVYLICTHLGCTPNYTTTVTQGTGVSDSVASSRGERGSAGQPNGWACPCHGSRYFIDSTNFYGPAPRPMDWVDVQYAPDGFLVVDRGKLVVQRSAGDTVPPQWRLDPKTKKDNGQTLGV